MPSLRSLPLAAAALAAAACGPSSPGETDAGGCPGPGEMRCGGECVDTRSDPDHCGGCAPCDLQNASADCSGGACVIETCVPGFCDTDGMAQNGCEAEPDFQTDSQNCGTCGNVCSIGACNAGDCARRVFVTSEGFEPDFGGLAAADALCQEEAEAAGLGGSWRAWLADDTESPATRFTQSSQPYQRVDGETVAEDWTDLTDGTLQAAIELTAAGEVQDDPRLVWTNVATDGTVDGSDDCEGWTSLQGGLGARGQNNLTDASWTTGGAGGCGIFSFALYCFEQ